MYVMGTLLDPDDHVFVVGMREDEPEEVNIDPCICLYMCM